MIRHARSTIYLEEQEEQLYCAAPQDSDKLICEGSDAEQTALEIRKKRWRYEETGRRFLSGHRHIIQSAILHGPLSQQSGWVNPWRSRPQKELDWWRPGSVEMSFKRENVKRKPGAHGLEYSNPSQALARCKAAAEREVGDHFDSMNGGHCSEEPRKQQGHEDSARDAISPTQPYDGHHAGHDHATNYLRRHHSTADTPVDVLKGHGFANGSSIGLKRPAETQWLEESYVSKRARWEDTLLSSPTPLLDVLSARDPCCQESSTRSATSQRQPGHPASQSTTPWTDDEQQCRPVSRSGQSLAQGVRSEVSEWHVGKKVECFDELREDSQGKAGNVPDPDFLAYSQGNTKPPRSSSRPRLAVAADHVTITSATDTLLETPVQKIGVSVGRSVPALKTLPVLPRCSNIGVVADLDEHNSAITEVAPSFENLEKFLFKKKRRKSRQQCSGKHCEDFRAPLQLSGPLSGTSSIDLTVDLDDEPAFSLDPFQQLSGSTPTDRVKELNCASSETNQMALLLSKLDPVEELVEFNVEASLAIDLVDLPMLKPLQEDLSVNPGERSKTSQLIGFTSTADDSFGRMQMATASAGSRQSDESTSKREVLLPSNMLPNLQPSSPFALFGSFDASKATASELLALEQQPTSRILEDCDPGLATDFREDDTVGEVMERQFSEGSDDRRVIHLNADASADVEAASSQISNRQHGALAISRSISKKPQKLSRLPSQVAAKCDQFVQGDDPCRVVNASTQLNVALLETTVAKCADEQKNAASTHPLHKSPSKAQVIPEIKGYVANLTQETSIDDGSTQSRNTSSPIPSRKPRLPTQFEPISHRRISLAGSGDSSDNVQNALSQHRQWSSASKGSRLNERLSLQQSGSAPSRDPELRKITSPIPEEDDQVRRVDLKRSGHGSGPQSPWVPAIFLPQTVLHSYHDSIIAAKAEPVEQIDSSLNNTESDIGLDCQAVDQSGKPRPLVFTPKRDVRTTIASPSRHEVTSNHKGVSSSQQFFEAVTKNPRASNSTKSVSGKLEKRVSFREALLEAKSYPQAEISAPAKHLLRSPPPQQTSDRSRIGNTSDDDDPPFIGKFGHHFSAAARLKTNSGTIGSLLASPALGAMAERFIAADRETSVGQERWPGFVESPTQHLRPKSDATMNLSPETIDYDFDVNLDEVLGEAGDFLKNWSVDSEVKKVHDSKARRGNGSDFKKRRGSELTSVWS